VTPDSYVRAKIAGLLIDRAESTLENWRNLGVGPAHVSRGGRIYYALAELARWIVQK
jgi:hypothetical protein